MRIAVTGSIATDHLMVFPGSFTEQLIEGSLEKVSLSFLAESLDMRHGGVAANVCFGLGGLGLRPLLVGAVGRDFEDYRVRLEEHGVDTSAVHVHDTRHTARFVCTTDRDLNQIATFYAGAMAEAHRISVARAAARAGGVDLVLVSPDDPAAMLRHTAECRANGLPFAADPSQQLATLGRDEVRELLDGARHLFTNEYEAALLQERAEWTAEQVLARVGCWVTTLGAEGARVETASGDTVKVPAVPVAGTADPTGAGDAFRAGFLAGLAWDLGPEQAARLGCALAASVLEVVGTQTYRLSGASLLERIRAGYGDAAAGQFAPRLAAVG
uniref:Putative kinase n=1 Tax=Streptomyces sp. UC 11065 TaxID=428401 RepID=A3R4T7_9ACTN|nr:putative kinase [Streptomyces sp. UC 11065]